MDEPKNENNNTEIDKLTKCEQEKEEYLNNWKRERADFLNYKKDEIKRLEEFIKFANEAIVLEVIEILDDLEKAATEIKNEGLDQVSKKFQELLKKYGVERIKTKGAFDPLRHEAVTTETNHRNAEETENTEKKEERIEEVRAGYMMQGKVIRPARVKIVK